MKGHRASLRLLPVFVVAFIISIVIYNNARLTSKNYLLRRSLVHPKFSPWRRLLNFGDEGSFLEMTGFNFDGFRELVGAVANTVELNPGPRSRGRPKLLNIEDEIGLYLYYVNSTVRAKHLAQLFGIVPATVTTTILRMMKRVVKGLRNHEASKIFFPTNDQMEIFARMINLREPTIDDVIGFLDGMSIPVQCSDDPIIQNAFFNGYHQDTMVNNIFLFSPEGKILFACYNAPGSWHDSHVARPLVTVVLDKLGQYKICVDQGFKRSGNLLNKFVGPISKSRRRNLSPVLRQMLIRQHNIYVSLRQSSEWGMRALEGSFSRLKSRLTSKAKTRRNIIFSILLLLFVLPRIKNRCIYNRG